MHPVAINAHRHDVLPSRFSAAAETQTLLRAPEGLGYAVVVPFGTGHWAVCVFSPGRAPRWDLTVFKLTRKQVIAMIGERFPGWKLDRNAIRGLVDDGTGYVAEPEVEIDFEDRDGLIAKLCAERNLE